jgi:hydroxymethylglutaryl-CoA reductase
VNNIGLEAFLFTIWKDSDDTYLDMLQDFLMRQLQEEVDKDLFFPQNMVHLHFYVDVSDLLGKNMTNTYVVTSSVDIEHL